MVELIVLVLLLIIIVAVLISCIRVVPQTQTMIIERLGTYKETWGTGLHFKLPIFDQIASRVTIKEQVIDFLPQPVITKDNVTINVDTVVYFQITDAKLYAYGIVNPIVALENLTATTLRNIIGDLELDQSLTGRDIINSKMRIILDEATDVWGVKVNRVELKNIDPPLDIKNAMEKQMRAERERRQLILIAEGQKKSEILKAEGDKQSTILRAEADKEAAIKNAEGRAEAILKINDATARGLIMIKNVNPTKELLALQSLDSLVKVADGNATKIIIPSDIQNLAGLVTSMSELVKDTSASKKEEKN